jgi:photosystem II stability/assembly factor-like uncharacterized protein
MQAVTDTFKASDPVYTPKVAAPARSLRVPSRRTLILVGLAWIGLASIVAVRQPPSGNPLEPPTGLSWWLHPIERNALLRLHATGEVHRLERHPDTGDLFGIGGAGLVVRSTDGGDTWEQRPVLWGPSGESAPARTQTTTELLRDDLARATFDVPKGKPQQQNAVPNYETKSPPDVSSKRPETGLNAAGPSPLPPDPSRRPYADLFDIEFAAGGRGRIVGANNTVLVTDDRGATWRLDDSASSAGFVASVTDAWNLSTPAPFERVTARYSDTARRGWTGDAAGRIHYTTDGGASWETRELPVRREVRSIVASGTRVIAALAGYGLVRSDDNGDSWSLFSAPPLHDAHFMSNGVNGWAVGGVGLVLRTTDGGVSWRVTPSGTTGTLVDVQFLEDGQRGWIAGQEGIVLRTTNGGGRWTQSTVPGPITAICMDPTGLKGVIAAGSGDLITSDGGETWTPQTVIDVGWPWRGASSPLGATCLSRLNDPGASYESWALLESWPPIFPLSVAFARHPDGRGWAIGRSGLLGELPSRGTDWTSRDGVLPTDFDALSIGFSADGARGWISGTRIGELWATADAGRTWQPQRVNRIALWHRIVGLPRGGAIALTAGSLIYRTTDGSEWQPVAHRAYPAPWYYVAVACGLGVIALVVSSKPEVVVAAKPSVADVFVSDRPLERGDPDALALNRVAAGIARYLANEKTDPPLTIAVTGEWGSGKTSLMNLSRAMLEDFGFRTVWFNAWHHQTEEHLLGALIESLRRNALQPWWAPRGFAVRIRLLVFRGMRQWLPAAAALVGFGIAAGYFLQEPSDRLWDAGSWLKGLLNFDASRLTTEHTFDVLSIIGTAGGLTRLVKGMQAFGVSGRRLSTALTTYDPLKDLRLPTGFRHQFADTFRDITRALAPQQLVIFIDDLDRCQPANVVATLEMVNFLVSSGRCIVIIGMARDRVERCVGIGFKDVAELGADEAGTEDPKLIASRRLERFARQYLEKLINIEIPIPQASPAASKQLLTTAFHRRNAYSQRWAASAVSLGQWAAAATIVVALGTAGYQGGIWIHHEATRIDARERDEASRQKQQGTVAQLQTPAAPVAPSSAPERNLERPPIEAVLVPAAAGSTAWLPVALIAGFGVLLAVPRLARVPVHVEHDSMTFTDALDRWFPLVYGKTSTPRAIKRFLNRVRFYAMSQREAAPPVADGTSQQIPEDALVALSVMQHAGATTVHDALAHFGLDADPIWRAQLIKDLEAALPYRDPFRRMSEGVSM